jgi:hypothetical protein|eukprot:COSAG06_NODE_12_length_35417_cov_270.698992_19_plen_98_part_00
MQAVDLDGDDEISFSEFCLVMSQPLLPPISEIVIEQHVTAAASSEGGGGSAAAAAIEASRRFAVAWDSADASTREKMREAIQEESDEIDIGRVRARL